ncbi:MAG: hypothetical protein HFE44_05185 [Oscillospiraceae bacterium]|jgi:dipicolinate synthase subunit A|nr:hypothetical protein [Oscillospiraceae bacterium]
MPAKSVFTVIGGDKRLYFLAQELLKTGPVICCAAVEVPQGAVRADSLREAFQAGDILLFPVPFTRDGETIPAAAPISIQEAVKEIRKEHRYVFGGKLPEQLKARCRELNVPFFDWLELESVALPNAILTAEGAILEALQAHASLCRTRAAVLGYGRCGKALAARLRGLCTETVVFARNPLQRAEAEMQCIPAEPLEALSGSMSMGQYGLLFNTIPSMVMSGEMCSRLSPGAVILDLASGALEQHMDTAAIRSAGARAALCPGLPGKYFPEEAGRILARAVLTELNASA